MNHNANFIDWGSIEYKEAWEKQEFLFNGIMEIKLQNRNNEIFTETPNYFVLCEHPHVYTLGKSGSDQNLLINAIQLQAKNATFFHTNRGGDITYHGPGQIVGYPIIDLENFDLGLKEYIHNVEEVIINVIKKYGLNGERLDGATGVWLDVSSGNNTRKICAIGVKSSRHITMHGFALNVNTMLDYFNYINPCGFVDKGVTSLQKEVGVAVDLVKVKSEIKTEIRNVFGVSWI